MPLHRYLDECLINHKKVIKKLHYSTIRGHDKVHSQEPMNLCLAFQNGVLPMKEEMRLLDDCDSPRNEDR